MASLFKIKKVFKDSTFWFLREIELPIEGMNAYIENTDQVISEIKISIEKHDNLLENGTQREINKSFDLLDYYSKKGAKELYYNSIFITQYSFLERKMLQICKIGEKKKSIKINDFAGSGIFKYYSYLSKVLDIDMSDGNSYWQEIVKLNQLRNLLVHQPTYEFDSSTISIKTQKVLKSIKYLNIIREDDIIELEISDKRFLYNFSEVIVEFLADIYFDNS